MRRYEEYAISQPILQNFFVYELRCARFDHLVSGIIQLKVLHRVLSQPKSTSKIDAPFVEGENESVG